MTRKYYWKLTTNVHVNKKNIFNIMCKKVGMRKTTRKSTTHQKCKTNTKLWSFGYTLYGHLTTWQESNLVQEKPFLWAQDWRLQQEWKGNEPYKAHVSRSKQQSTKESFSSFRDRSQLSEIGVISKAPLSLALQVGNKVTKSSSPINRRLQQEEHTTFEKKKKNIFIKNLFVYKSLKNYICFEQAALFVY